MCRLEGIKETDSLRILGAYVLLNGTTRSGQFYLNIYSQSQVGVSWRLGGCRNKVRQCVITLFRTHVLPRNLYLDDSKFSK